MDDIAEQINHEIIQSLRSLRLRQGLSHQQLADRTGLNRSYIGLLERSKRRPTLEVALRLSLALGQPLSKLLAEAEGKFKGKKIR